VQGNLKHGRSAESQFARWIPEAIQLRKKTHLSWQKIAEKFSERDGVRIPKSSLYRICQTWLKSEQKRSALPDVSARIDGPQGRALSPSNPVKNSPRQTSSTALSVADSLDESARAPSLKIKIMKNSNKYHYEQK
jgi:hypothetical protein